MPSYPILCTHQSPTFLARAAAAGGARAGSSAATIMTAGGVRVALCLFGKVAIKGHEKGCFSRTFETPTDILTQRQH